MADPEARSIGSRSVTREILNDCNLEVGSVRVLLSHTRAITRSTA